MPPTAELDSRPIRLALVDDYEVVLRGVAKMFEQYRDQIEVVEIDAREPVTTPVDIALYDTFAQAEVDEGDVEALITNRYAHRVVVYTWAFAPELVDQAIDKGIDGYLSKTLQAADLVDALVRIHHGETVVSPTPSRSRTSSTHDWPGRAEGLTERESEVVALIVQGFSNKEVAAMMYLSPNSIKTYIRASYRKMGVSSRTQAVLWGIGHGFEMTGRQLDRWR